MFTDEGFEVVSTGMTVGGVTPVSVPAGEGGLPFGLLVSGLLGAAGFALVAGRRLVVSG